MILLQIGGTFIDVAEKDRMWYYIYKKGRKVTLMGIYLNPGNEKFKRACNSEIYIDKTELIDLTNKVINTEQNYICISRPRRFGKSMAANMLAAYYGKGCLSEKLFNRYKIAKRKSYRKNLNQYNVIALNIQIFRR